MAKKVFTCSDFSEFYSVGAAAVIVAEDKREARSLMRAQLKGMGLKTTKFSLQEVDLDGDSVTILNDGNY